MRRILARPRRRDPVQFPGLDSETKCPRCGATLPAGSRFCATCGYAAGRLVPGEVLDGKYEILEKIGEGGMGEVYKARHIHLDEIRIIKVTKPDALGEGPEPRRFQEEARIATLVRHPNVAALYDFSRLPDGSFYMVWEFIDGITLEEWLRRYGPLPAPRALEVSRQVLAGLAQIHAQGIVHRDLAPDNIMLRETRDGRLTAKIIDLGIAKRVTGEALERMTGTGMFVGKLKYCSPEQAGSLAPGEKVDNRSDLYSFGVVLYEMLVGRAPFQSETPEGYLGKHLHAEPPPLDTSRLPAKIGPALSSIVTRALEKRRERRFRNAEEFATALTRLAPEIEAEDEPTTRMGTARSRAGWVWVIGGVLLAGASVAAYRIVHRTAAVPVAAVTPLPTEAPLPGPTAIPAPDDVVVQPRILENPTPAEGIVHAAPTAPPAATRPPPTHPPVPTAPALRPTAAGEAVDVPGMGEVTDPKLRRLMEEWTSRPVEGRARGAVRVAWVAHRWIAAHPDAPLAREIEEKLARALKDDGDRASRENRPLLAMEFYVGYLQLHPEDAEVMRRVQELRERGRGKNRFPR
jgi:tRNA A-37 threonylcarbamoyl transferase component Bud32